MDAQNLKVILVSAVLLSACVPWPHRAHLTPAVKGVITADSAPVSEVKFKVVASGQGFQVPPSCEGKSHEFVSQQDGSFYGKPVKQFHFFMYVMAHTSFSWAVCAEENGQWRIVHSDQTYTLVDIGPAYLLQLECKRGPGLACEETNYLQPSPGELEEWQRNQ